MEQLLAKFSMLVKPFTINISVFGLLSQFKVIRWSAAGRYIWEVFLRYRVEKISYMKGR